MLFKNAPAPKLVSSNRAPKALKPSAPTRQKGKFGEWFKSIRSFEKPKSFFKKSRAGKKDAPSTESEPAPPVTPVVRVTEEEITDESVIDLLKLLKSYPGLDPAHVAAVTDNLADLVAPIPAKDVAEISKCVTLLTSAQLLLTPDAEPAKLGPPARSRPQLSAARAARH
ncbi:hypothetical protein HDU96_004349 [Phlyctochytrium bullatum]|nr:hypothetical protein HDU96_004349 [Phlyctochytrium bullatum]